MNKLNLPKIADFSERVRQGLWVGATGKPLTTVVSIGIGGSCKFADNIYINIIILIDYVKIN